MQELRARFTPADGTEPRVITLRIGAPVKGETCWSALVEVLGFDEPHARPIYGEDWAQALELAAKLLPVILQAEAGDGTLDPPFYPRDTTPSPEAEEAAREFGFSTSDDACPLDP